MYSFCCLLQIGDTVEEVQKTVIDICKTEVIENSKFLLGLFLGFILYKFFDKFLAQGKVEKAYKILLESKDELIDDYKALVSERLEKVQVEKQDKEIFKRLKRFFKSKTKRKGK